MGLRDQREATAHHPLDQPDLPQRLGAIQSLREQPASEPLERLLVGGFRQGRVANVVARVEIGIVHPHWSPLLQRNVRQPLAIARDEVQAAQYVIDELLRARRGALEDHHRRHVHVGGRVVLEV